MGRFRDKNPGKSDDLNDREYSDYYHFRIRWENHALNHALTIKFNLIHRGIIGIVEIRAWSENPDTDITVTITCQSVDQVQYCGYV